MEKKIGTVDLLLFSVTFVWGLNFTVVKYSLEFMPPLAFNAFRYLLAVLFLLLLRLRFKRKWAFSRSDLLPLIGLSLLGHTLYQLLFIMGIRYTTAANAALMLGTIPIWISILSHFFFDEKMNRFKTIGVFIAFTGLVIMVLNGKASVEINDLSLLGDLLILLSAATFGLFTLLSKEYLKKYDNLSLTTFMMIVGGITIVAVGLPYIPDVPYHEISNGAIWGVLYSGLLSIALSYIIWNYGLQKVGAVRTAAYQNLVPVIGVLLGVILLNEVMNAIQITGAVAVVTGIIITRTAFSKG